MKANGACDFGLFKHNLCSVLEPRTVRKCRTRVASASLEITHHFRFLLLPPTESGYTSDLSEQLSGRVPPSPPLPPPRVADSVWMRQRVGGCALLREGRDKSSSERIRKERTGKSGTGGFSPHVVRFSPRVNGQKLVREGKRKWRHRTRGEMEAVARWIYAILLVGLSTQG